MFKGEKEFSYLNVHKRLHTFFMFNPRTHDKYFYKFNEELLDQATSVLKIFCALHPTAFTLLKSGARVFHSFNIAVKVDHGRLILSKGSAEESSSSTDPLTSKPHSRPLSEGIKSDTEMEDVQEQPKAKNDTIIIDTSSRN